jgi:protein NEDD1
VFETDASNLIGSSTTRSDSTDHHARAGSPVAEVSGSASAQWQLVRGVLEEMMQSLRTEVNSQIQNLHLEMLRQFQFQQMELATLFDQMSVRREMIEEVRRLRDENERLRNMY